MFPRLLRHVEDMGAEFSELESNEDGIYISTPQPVLCDMVMMVNVTVNLTQYRVTWEESLSEASSRSGWPVGTSLRDCLDYGYLLMWEDPDHCGHHHSLDKRF